MSEARIVLVTGGNTGLGFEIVRALCASDVAYEILLGGRSLQNAEHAVQTLSKEFPTTRSHPRAVQLDLEHDDSINTLSQLVYGTYGRLDVLINNGGTQLDRDYKNSMTTREMWNKTYDVNVTGTHMMTSAFAPLLVKSSDPRLLFLTSGMSSLDGSEDDAIIWNRAPPKGWPKPPVVTLSAYRCSKTALNMLMREWHRTLKEDGVKTWCISPGYLATGLGGSRETNVKGGAIDPAIGARLVKDVVEGKRDADVGKVVRSENIQQW